MIKYTIRAKGEFCEVMTYEKPGFYNADCMEAMKQFPDKFFDLAIVDPPYGGGNSDIGGAEVRSTVRQVQDITRSDCGRRSGITRTGGTWAEKYAKKLLRGTSPRSRNILTNCSVFHVTRLSGGATISNFHRQGALLYGAN